MKVTVRVLGLGRRIADARVARLAEQAARSTPTLPSPAPTPPLNEPPR